MQQPSFDNWTIMFLVFALIGLIIGAIIFLTKKNLRHIRVYLSLVLILFSLTLIDYVLYWTKYDIYFPHSLGIVQLFYFLYGPLLFLYIEQLEGAKRNYKYVYHFIPFLIFILLSMPLFLLSYNSKSEIMKSGHVPFLYLGYVLKAIPWISIIHLLIYGFIILTKAKIFAEFKLIKRWVLFLSFATFGIAISYLSYMVLAEFNLIKLEWDYAISFVMSLFILIITILGLIQPDIFNDTLPADQSNNQKLPLKKYKNSPIDEKSGKRIAEKINQTMLEGNLWRDGELRLEQLAKIIDIPRHYLSQIINEQFKMNYFEFINHYRIEEAKKIFEKNGKKLTAIEVGYQVGFNNKVSFNKAFKSFTGMTPLEYKKSIIYSKVEQT
jgi:AraC-like DNA-binding protein